MADWKEYKLSEIADVQTGPFGSQLHMSDYKTIGTPIITVEHLGENKILHHNLPLVSDEDKIRLAKYVLQEGDIVFSRVGSVDRCAYVSKDEDGWLFSGRCLRVRAIKSSVDTKFLSYYFGQERFKEHIRSIAVGATMPSINTEILSEVAIRLVELSEQRVIAEILASLDDKIDMLHGQNKTLESLAETLFRQWFIKEGQEDWETKTLRDFIEVKHGYAFKGTNIVAAETDKILVTPGNFKIGGGFNFHKYKYYNIEEFPKAYVLAEGDFVVTMTDLSQETDTLGFPAFIPAIAGKRLLHNQRVGKVVLRSGHSGKQFFIYHVMKSAEYRHYILGSSSGMAVTHTSPTAICGFRFKVPDSSLIKKFEEHATSIYKKERANQKQIQTLMQLRDKLLPKLMSGEVRVAGPGLASC